MKGIMFILSIAILVFGFLTIPNYYGFIACGLGGALLPIPFMNDEDE